MGDVMLLKIKVENEGNNILKNQGYNLEHNFGHGIENLAEILLLSLIHI